MSNVRIRFLPQNRAAVFPAGTTLHEAALELGILIESACAGVGTCGKCRVEVKQGGGPVTDIERQLLTPRELAKGVRLACRAAIDTGTLCTVPPTSLPAFHDGLAWPDDKAKRQFDITTTKVRLRPPSPGEKAFRDGMLCRALTELGLPITKVSLPALRELAKLPQDRELKLWAITHGDTVLGLFSAEQTPAVYGLAADVGTTSVAVRLVDLAQGQVVAAASVLNAQAAHGADVLSRVNFCTQKPSGTKVLHRAVIQQINALLQKLSEQSGISPQHIYRVMVAGNTVMQHLFLNINPATLGVKPFAPLLQGPVNCAAAELGLAAHPAALVTVLPNLGTFVGSDVTAGLSVLDLDVSEGVRLAVDMGTNGEIVLGNRKRLLCASSPAGPAWEGACMRWGMRAAPGAIERAEIVDGDLQLRTIADAPPIGVCGSGLIDLVAAFRRAGVINASGRILPPEKAPRAYQRFVEPGDGGARLRIAETEDGAAIILTQADVREIQLAKAAIAAGVRVLMRELAIEAADIERVYIAGAFGNHIRSQDVIDLGLLPKLPPERIQFVGNAALAGATAALCSVETQKRAAEIAGRIEYVEISGRPDFENAFVEAIALSTDNGGGA